MRQKTNVILVDRKDRVIGKEEKLKAHKEGKLHRAFSILIFNHKGEMLLQKRAKSKYHSGGLWSNACCSHPRPGRNLLAEAQKRLKEEMGIECDLKEIFSFIYRVNIGNLIEYEFDHIFLGRFDGNPKPDKNEAEAWKWLKLKALKNDIKENPDKYTYWFKTILAKWPIELKNYTKSFAQSTAGRKVSGNCGAKDQRPKEKKRRCSLAPF